MCVCDAGCLGITAACGFAKEKEHGGVSKTLPDALGGC